MTKKVSIFVLFVVTIAISAGLSLYTLDEGRELSGTAAYADQNGIKWFFEVTGDEATLNYCEIPTGRVVKELIIPEEVSDDSGKYKTTRIGSFFCTVSSTLNNSDIERIVFPDSVREIYSGAFSILNNLKSVEFGDQSELEYIHDYAFQRSGIAYKDYDPSASDESGDDKRINLTDDKTIELGITSESVEYELFVSDTLIANNGYPDPTISRVIIRDSSNVMVKDTVYNEKITISSGTDPSSVKVNLSDADFPEGYKAYVILKSDSKGIRMNVVTFAIEFKTSTGDDPEKLPDYLQVTLPKSVKRIGMQAFNYAMKVTIPEDSLLEQVGDNAFDHIRFPFEIPRNVSDIGANAFNPTAEITLSHQNSHFILESGNLIHSNDSSLVAYYGSAEHYQFPDDIKSVGSYAFSGNVSIKTVTIPADVQWGMFPFGGIVSLETVQFEDDVVEIPDFLLSKMPIKEITIPSGIRIIGQKAVYDNPNLESVTFDDDSHISEIKPYAFGHNLSLKNVTFGSHADGFSCSIGDGAFFWCNNLESIYFDSDTFHINSIGTGAFAKNLTSGDKTGSAVSFGKTQKAITIPGTVEYIGAGAFSANGTTGGHSAGQTGEPGLYMMTADPLGGRLSAPGFFILFEDNPYLNAIGKGAFSTLLGVIQIDLSKCTNLKTIEQEAFSRTYNTETYDGPSKGPTSISLPDGLEEIGAQAFYRSNPNVVEGVGSVLGDIRLPRSVTTIGDFAFYNTMSTIEFEEDPLLRSVGKQIVNVDPNIDKELANLVDLSNCHALQIVYPNRMKLPEGVYTIVIGSDASRLITNFDEVVLEPNEAGELAISGSTKAISDSALRQTTSVNITSNNDYFRMEDGCLLYGISEYEIVWLQKDVKNVIIDQSSKVTKIHDQAFSNSDIESLTISKKDVALGDSLFEGLSNKMSVLLDTVNDLTIQNSTFGGSSSDIAFYVPNDANPDVKEILKSCGSVSIGHRSGDAIVYLPSVLGGRPVSYSEISSDNGTITIRPVLWGGYTLYDVTVSADGSDLPTSGDKISVDIGGKTRIFITMTIKDRSTGTMVEIQFYGSGGTSNGRESVIIKIPSSLTLIDSDIPTFIKNGDNPTGWVDSSGGPFDFDSPLTRNTVISAVWGERGPQIIVLVDSGSVYLDDQPVDRIETVVGEKYTLNLIPRLGYQVHRWMCNGEDRGSALEPLTLEGGDDDVFVTATYTYSSPSSGLNPVSDRGLPTTDDLTRAIKSWSAGGVVDRSGSYWSGHSSVPLIVDDHVYIRVGTGLYKIESDTGYVVKKVDSLSTYDYYHQLGYGNGLIIDYYTQNVYDLDLELQFKLDSRVSGLEFHDGYFYTSGTTLKRFPADASKAVNGVMPMEKIGVFSKSAYSSYGFSISVFKDGCVYRVYAEGRERGITSMGIDASDPGSFGVSKYVAIPGLESTYLDDGWLSGYKDTLYLPGYTHGLFGAVAKIGYDTLGYVKVDGINFGTPDSYEFTNETTFTSQLVVSDGIGYIVAGLLHAFRMNDDGTLGELLGKAPLSFSHGSITVESSYATEDNGYLTYLYMIPYYTSTVTMSAVECYTDSEGNFVMRNYTYSNFEQNYNSQTIRAGLEGQMIWYNDYCWIYSYTLPEKNRFFFFIEDDGVAQWYESYGATAADALKALGSDVVTLTASNGLATMFGEDADGWDLYYLKQDILGYQNPRTDPNGWKKIDNLFDTKLNSYHYYAITTSNAPTTTDYRFVDGSNIGTYTFADNVGDRSVVGKKLIAAADVFTIRFYDGDSEIGNSALIGAMGSEVDGSFPSMYRADHIANWYARGTDDRVTELPKTFSGNLEYEVRWVKAEYALKATIRTVGDTVFFEFSAEAKSGGSNLMDARVLLHAKYGNAFFTKTFSGELDLVDGRSTAMLGVSSSDLSYVVAYLVEGTPTTDRYGFYAEYIHEAGA